MQDKMAQVLIIVAALTPIVSGLTEVFKQAFFKSRTDWVPLVALAVGICAGIVTSYLLAEPLRLMILAGAIAGLTASGFYKALTLSGGAIADKLFSK